jgi:hypothetical protein
MQIGWLLIGKDYFLFCTAIQQILSGESSLSLSLKMLTVVITAMIECVKRYLIKYHAVETYLEAGIQLQAPTIFPQGKEPTGPIT